MALARAMPELSGAADERAQRHGPLDLSGEKTIVRSWWPPIPGRPLIPRANHHPADSAARAATRRCCSARNCGVAAGTMPRFKRLSFAAFFEYSGERHRPKDRLQLHHPHRISTPPDTRVRILRLILYATKKEMLLRFFPQAFCHEQSIVSRTPVAVGCYLPRCR
jgi:hypothetical protein